MIRQRVRIRFRKEGDLRWIGHRELLRVVERLFRRADLRLGMSEGFHPKARMSFPSALSLGIRGLDEVMEFELAEEMPQDELAERLRQHAPPGLTITHVQLLGPNDKKAQVETLTYEMPVPAERHSQLQTSIEQLLARPSLMIERPGRGEPIDVRDDLEHVELDGGAVRFRLRATRTASVRPREIVEALGLSDLLDEGFYLTRSKVELTSAPLENTNT